MRVLGAPVHSWEGSVSNDFQISADMDVMLQVVFKGSRGDRKFFILSQLGSGWAICKLCHFLHSFLNLVKEIYRAPALSPEYWDSLLFVLSLPSGPSLREGLHGHQWLGWVYLGDLL